MNIYPTAYVDPDEIVYIQKAKLANTLSVNLEDKCILEGVRQTLEQFKDGLGECFFVATLKFFG